MKLKHYWTSRGTFVFDPSSGDVTRTRSNERSRLNWGSVWKQRGRWFALWHDGDSLVFQHRHNRFKLTTDLTLRVTGRYRRTFQVLRSGDEVFRFTYFAKWALFAHVDPTYDALDAESDDFFLYVTAMWEHWKDRTTDDFAALLQESGTRFVESPD